MKRLTVVGNGLNVSPKEWKSAQPGEFSAYMCSWKWKLNENLTKFFEFTKTISVFELSSEEKVNSFMTKFQLTPAQIERLRIIYPTDRPYGELQVSEFSSFKQYHFFDIFLLLIPTNLFESKKKREKRVKILKRMWFWCKHCSVFSQNAIVHNSIV